MPLDTLLESYYVYGGGVKKECTSNSSNAQAKGKGLFIKGFYKCSLGGNTLKAIKGVTRLI